MTGGAKGLSAQIVAGGAAYPPSFQGDGWLFASALASVTAIACLGLMVAGWMAREIWRDRYHVHPKTPVTVFRLILGAAGLAAFIRAAPEAVYMLAYGEDWAAGGVMAAILLLKRAADSIAIVPVLTWMALAVVSYPYIVLSLKANGARVAADMWSPWHKLWRPLGVLAIVAAIAVLVSIGKQVAA